MKKNFLQLGVFWILRALIGGFLYAAAAFFTKNTLENWKSKTKNYFKKSGIDDSKKLD